MSHERAPSLIMQPLIRLCVSAAQWLLSPRRAVLNNAVRLSERREGHSPRQPRGRSPFPGSTLEFVLHNKEADCDISEAPQSHHSREVPFSII